MSDMQVNNFSSNYVQGTGAFIGDPGDADKFTTIVNADKFTTKVNADKFTTKVNGKTVIDIDKIIKDAKYSKGGSASKFIDDQPPVVAAHILIAIDDQGEGELARAYLKDQSPIRSAEILVEGTKQGAGDKAGGFLNGTASTETATILIAADDQGEGELARAYLKGQSPIRSAEILVEGTKQGAGDKAGGFLNGTAPTETAAILIAADDQGEGELARAYLKGQSPIRAAEILVEGVKQGATDKVGGFLDNEQPKVVAEILANLADPEHVTAYLSHLVEEEKFSDIGALLGEAVESGYGEYVESFLDGLLEGDNPEAVANILFNARLQGHDDKVNNYEGGLSKEGQNSIDMVPIVDKPEAVFRTSPEDVKISAITDNLPAIIFNNSVDWASYVALVDRGDSGAIKAFLMSVVAKSQTLTLDDINSMKEGFTSSRTDLLIKQQNNPNHTFGYSLRIDREVSAFDYSIAGEIKNNLTSFAKGLIVNSSKGEGVVNHSSGDSNLPSVERSKGEEPVNYSSGDSNYSMSNDSPQQEDEDDDKVSV